MVDKNTKLYFSVSSNPGNFGATLYNAAFRHLGMNAIYKPLQLTSSCAISFAEFLASVRRIGAHGLSVSMPFKKMASILSYVEGNAKEIGNINTIRFTALNNGYNTDYVGFGRARQKLTPYLIENAYIFGTGAMADSIGYVLYNHFNIYCRKIKRGESLPTTYDSKDLLVNATPVGMDGVEDDIFTEELVDQFKYVADVVVKQGDTNLIKIAKKLHKSFITGADISLEQLCEQFQIYTGIEPPRDLFLKKLQENGYV